MELDEEINKNDHEISKTEHAILKQKSSIEDVVNQVAAKPTLMYIALMVGLMSFHMVGNIHFVCILNSE